ncbi:hypothetical protein NPX13_g7799 [Xylaria arbuscula]|uniref:Heterokaryon incompatibility domain-containing protein n=1 Tax=Xylaria arbuscula TaxID=114810 RepID=A0A9W8TKF5_9PEZI|nr:hypothetical protein NPX13_g7799 [Xylaria arbuscula]
MATYRYEPLPPVPEVGKATSFTRLMCLAPGTGDQALECTLITIDIANSPLEYEALSYVWGAKEPQVPIKCDGFNIPMTLNLQHALLALRLPTIPRPLWVDAICINQEDMNERARQVAYMRLVYQYADRVVVWLGQESAVIQRGLTRARELCEYRLMLNSTATNGGNSLQSASQQANMQIDRIVLESLIAETGSAEAASQSINDLVQLLETSYFERWERRVQLLRSPVTYSPHKRTRRPAEAIQPAEILEPGVPAENEGMEAARSQGRILGWKHAASADEHAKFPGHRPPRSPVRHLRHHGRRPPAGAR